MIRKILEGKNPVKKNKVINKKMGGASEERVDQRLVWFNQGFRAGLCSLKGQQIKFSDGRHFGLRPLAPASG